MEIEEWEVRHDQDGRPCAVGVRAIDRRPVRRRVAVIALAEAEEIGLDAAMRRSGVTLDELKAASFVVTGAEWSDEEGFRRAHRDYWERRAFKKPGAVCSSSRERADMLGSYTFWLGRDAA